MAEESQTQNNVSDSEEKEEKPGGNWFTRSLSAAGNYIKDATHSTGETIANLLGLAMQERDRFKRMELAEEIQTAEESYITTMGTLMDNYYTDTGKEGTMHAFMNDWQKALESLPTTTQDVLQQSGVLRDNINYLRETNKDFKNFAEGNYESVMEALGYTVTQDADGKSVIKDSAGNLDKGLNDFERAELEKSNLRAGNVYRNALLQRDVSDLASGKASQGGITSSFRAASDLNRNRQGNYANALGAAQRRQMSQFNMLQNASRPYQDALGRAVQNEQMAGQFGLQAQQAASKNLGLQGQAIQSQLGMRLQQKRLEVENQKNFLADQNRNKFDPYKFSLDAASAIYGGKKKTKEEEEEDKTIGNP